MTLLDKLKEINRQEESLATSKQQSRSEKEQGYLTDKRRIDEKIETIVSYVNEVNQVSKNRIAVSKPEVYILRLVGERSLDLNFQGDNVEVTFTRYEDQAEDRTGSISIQLKAITSEKIDSWISFVAAYGDAPVKLQSSVARKDAKILKIIGLIFLLLLGVV